MHSIASALILAAAVIWAFGANAEQASPVAGRSLFDRSADIEPGRSAAGIRLGTLKAELPSDEQAEVILGLPVDDDVLVVIYYRDVQVVSKDGTIIGILVEGRYTGTFDQWLRIGARVADSPGSLTRVNENWLKLEKIDGVYLSVFDGVSTTPSGIVHRILITADPKLVRSM